jgi:hypothetical protein
VFSLRKTYTKNTTLNTLIIIKTREKEFMSKVKCDAISQGENSETNFKHPKDP